VLGGLGLAAFAGKAGRGKIWSISAYITPLMIAGFAFSRSIPLSLLLTVVIGVTSITVLNNTNAMIQSSVSDELRGRVMSLFSLMMMSGGPLGAVLLGVIADRTGISAVVLLCAGMALLFGGWVRFRAPQIRDMK
jgi:predicted MFS family arabinose efflux permease